jgi:hypothetical protein
VLQVKKMRWLRSMLPGMMMMSFICSCRNNNQPNAIYPWGTFVMRHTTQL